jgi:tetratricopeptide (TPR) repeat protein
MSEQRRHSVEELEAAVADLLVDDEADASRLESIVDVATELIELQRPDLALVHLENLVGTYRTGTAIEIQRQVARALAWQADCLRDLDRLDEAGVVAQACFSSYASADDPYLAGEALRAVFDQAWAVQADGQADAAIRLVDQLRERWKDNPPTGSEYAYMHALFTKALSLHSLGELAEAIELTGHIAQLFPSASSDDVSEFAARALELQGVALIDADRLEDAVTTLDELLSRYGERDDLDDLIASTLFRRAYPLRVLGRHDEALASLELVDRRFSDATDEAVRRRVASSLILMSEWLRDLDRRVDAIEWLDRTIDRYGDDLSRALRMDTAIALSWKGQYLRDLGRDPEAAGVFDEVVDRYSTDPDPELRRLVAGALLRKGRILEAAHRFAEASGAYARLVAQFDGDHAPEIDDMTRVGREQLHRLQGN